MKDLRDGGVIKASEDGTDTVHYAENVRTPYEAFSTGKMRRGKQAKVFDNNGGDSKAGDAGTVNNNSQYGAVTYGF